jgi:hypothetical protein
MNLQRSLSGWVLLPLLAGLAGCSGADESAPSELSPATASQPFSTTPGEPNHEEITALGLSFLRADILTAFQAANVATDVEYALQNANHFDDCNFTGGSQVVQSSQAEAVAQLNPKTASPETDLLALRAFARSLHALQDFYAHTNWVELGGKALVDESLGAFRTLSPYAAVASSGFIVIQGGPPKRSTLSRDAAAAYPASAVVTVADGKRRAPGLISGTVDYEEGNYCPASVAMTHEELNKDKSTLAERLEQHDAAKTLAILQTEHEWCRLRELTRAKWREAGVARLDAWVAEGATAPVCGKKKPAGPPSPSSTSGSTPSQLP